MTREEHIEKHKQLHNSLDELLADWVFYAPGNPRPSTSTVMDLMKRSAEQCKNPT